MQKGHPSASPKHLTVAIAADGNFSVPLALCVESLLMSAHKETFYDIHILDDGVRDDVRTYLQSLQSAYACTITHHDMSRKVEGVAANHQFPKVAFARFLLEDYLPQGGCERVFYTDADVLICEDLSPLFEMDMGGCALAAPQAINLVSGERYEYLKQWSELYHLDLSTSAGSYFQSGNLLIDCKRWNERGYGRKIVEKGIASDMRHTPMPDQDIMNAVCWGDIALMPARYCVIPLFEQRYDSSMYDATYGNRCLYSADELEGAITKPAVLHFAGVKPQVLQGARYAGEQAFIDFWKRSVWHDYLPYGPASYCRRPESYLNPALKLSEQKVFLQKKARLYNILAHLTTWPLRHRFRRWADGLKKMLQAMEH